MNQKTQKEIEQFIIDKLVEDFSLEIEEINVTEHTLKGLDSIEIIEVCMYLEKEYNINIPDENWEDWANKTISEIAIQVGLINQKK